MKRAFFVLGCEGSGTRCLTAAFIAAGCRGSAEHQQPLDSLDFSGEGDLVFRRSLPHGGEWPDLSDIALEMMTAGYYVQPVFVHRSSTYLAAHQLRSDREHDGMLQAPYATSLMQVSGNEAAAWIKASALAAELMRLLLVVPYEPFVELETVRRAFFKTLCLTYPEEMDFYNANAHPRYADLKALPW